MCSGSGSFSSSTFREQEVGNMGFGIVKEPKTKRFYVRFSENELATLKSHAEHSCMTMSEFARRAALGKRIVPKTDMTMLAELRRQGSSLRNLLNTANRPVTDEAVLRELQQSYKAILATISRAIAPDYDEQ